MAAEVYYLSVVDDRLAGMKAGIVPDGESFHAASYGSEEGLETFVKVSERGTHIFDAAPVYELHNGESRESTDVVMVNHIVMLKPDGDPYVETLTGPEGEEVIMYVRHIGENAIKPFLN